MIISVFGLWAYFKSLNTSISKIIMNPIKTILPKTDRFREQIISFLFFLICLSIFYYIVNYAIPGFKGSQHFALSYYSDFGNSPSNVIKNTILSPQKIAEILIQENRLKYLYNIFIPSGFLIIFAPQYLIFALPDLLINLLSNNAQLRQIYFHYNSNIIPFIFISSIYGIKNLKKFFPKISVNYFGLFILGSTIYSSILLGPLPGTKNPNLDMFIKQLPYRNVVNEFIKRVPQDFSIATTNNLGSHLSHRKEIFTIPIGIDKADIIMFLLNDPFAQPSLEKQKEMVDDLKRDKNYIEVFKHNDFIVFEKRNLYLKPQPKISQVNLFPLSIPALQHRDYIGGKIEIENKIYLSNEYSSFIISYPSDGLKLYSLMTIPNSTKPDQRYPVLIINHGYINPKEYNTVSSYEKTVDYFSSQGYVVLKPDYRGNGISEIDDTQLMRFAYPIDVLNLISSIDQIQEADKNHIYLFGHSMGGEVTLKVLEIIGKDPELSSRIKSAVVWAPVTDPIRWFEKNNLSRLPESKITPFPYQKVFDLLGRPEENPEIWQSLSPLTYLKDINIPLQINHGIDDEVVPYEWSIELYDDLISLNKKSRLNLYPETGHNLSESWNEATENSLDFFQKHP
ncbi:MAG: alpha/beta fold hydrolase [Actinobacteria bacterium]|nr:alpha/beta fold hydrolase [Actinomycetota bacterium]